MKKILSKKVIIVSMVAVVLVICVASIITTVQRQPKRMRDKEFQAGSKIELTAVTDLQTENLYNLAKVWGYVKYRHPAVTGGTVNWDYELFRVMPKVLEAATPQDANQAIFEWLDQFSFEMPVLTKELTETKEAFDKNAALKADFTWINDKAVLGDDLSGYLTRLSEVTVTDVQNKSVVQNGYVSFNAGGNIPNMTAEDSYSSMQYDDDGIRLLGLFRYWNIIEYFYPYKDIIGADWNQILQDMIPQFISDQDEQSYVLAVARLSTYIHDTHAVVSDPHGILSGYFGSKTPPVEFLNIDGQIVISATGSSQSMGAEPLMPGDIVLSMDGESIDERISKCKEYISISNEDRFVQAFRFCLLGTDKDLVSIEVLRDDERVSLNVSCFAEKSFLSGQEPSGFMEDEQIGYMNPGKLEKGDIDKLMEQFSNTKGIIIYGN